MKVLHYVNQFFAGMGGEDAASTPPVLIPGAVGPGRGLGLEISATLACGDDYFAEHEDDALGQLLAWLDEARPDVLVCGPAFGSGRYGYACGTLAREAFRLGIVSVCGMDPQNPGVLAAQGKAYIVPTSANVAGMRDALPKMAALTVALAAGEDPSAAGPFLPRHVRRNAFAAETGADRAVELLLAKIAGDTRSEIPIPDPGRIPPGPVLDIAAATIALVTESGCVPRGNPDQLPSRHARSWHRYAIDGVASLSPEHYESVHGGFELGAASEDPNRLVPLDALRQLEASRRVGTVHGWLYTTTGNGTPVAAAALFGQAIAAELNEEGVDGVILTGT
ncbi:MAG: glycine/betaine/sarcosine/D-proline family reductase selenoprotein B [Gaiellaceae bacterium MAG52_C11]|nr:glycine/betaine/sarcosine/D-proline family reductase selenoprotein B [Candidatus Gaiellasilicea maunaloa]